MLGSYDTEDIEPVNWILVIPTLEEFLPSIKVKSPSIDTLPPRLCGPWGIWLTNMRALFVENPATLFPSDWRVN